MKEAARVLRSGGIAAWSVWGRDEESPLFTTVPRYGARRHHAAAAAERRCRSPTRADRADGA